MWLIMDLHNFLSYVALSFDNSASLGFHMSCGCEILQALFPPDVRGVTIWFSEWRQRVTELGKYL